MSQSDEPHRPDCAHGGSAPPNSQASTRLNDVCRETAERLVAARGGSRAAMGELFESCRNYLLLVANTSVRGDLHAKFAGSDLVQETFLEASQIFGRFSGDSEEELLRWLTRILENKLGNAVKRHVWAAKRDVSREVRIGRSNDGGVFGPPLADSGLSPSRVVSNNEEGARIRTVLMNLSDDYRQVIELRVHQALSFEEIGRAMNRTSEAARKLFARAIDELRLRMHE